MLLLILKSLSQSNTRRDNYYIRGPPSITRGDRGRNIFEIYISKLNFREINNCLIVYIIFKFKLNNDFSV